MPQFLATSHQPQITVEHTEQTGSLTIVIDECPSITEPEMGLYRNLDIPIASVPALIKALAQAYEHVTGEKP
jgi:hypothetical protein